jgi:hypothetical protein
MLELVNLTSENGQQNREIFDLLQSFLSILDKADSNHQNLLFAFKSRLAGFLGFDINIHGMKYMDDVLVRERSTIYNDSREVTKNRLNIVDSLIKGNFNLVLSLNISEDLAISIDKFLDEYYRLHYDNLKFKVNKVL